MVDKIEAMTDGSVKVIDYKTGNPKPRSDQNYFRQLVFYKILLERFPGHNFKVNFGTLDYLEPNDSRLGRDGRGIYKKEEFELTTENVKKLIEQIKETASEIIGLKFWSQKCGHPDCAFCHLRSAMKN